jgi:CheY-like chemotaxis protein
MSVSDAGWSVTHAMSAHATDVRVVVVDDNPDAAQTIAELLGMNGYVVETVWDAHEALTVIDRFQPHCVVLDCLMPGMDGCELAGHLRARYGDGVVLIAVTGLDAHSFRVGKTFELVDHWVRKPIDYQKLAQVLPEVGRP